MAAIPFPQRVALPLFSQPSSGNAEGNVIHLTADVEQSATNEAMSAGDLAQWNGTKWVKYEGDIYV